MAEAKGKSIPVLVPDDLPIEPSCTVVRIKAERCRKVDDNTDDWEIHVQTQSITAEMFRTFEDFFPNTMRTIEKALATEALLASIR